MPLLNFDEATFAFSLFSALTRPMPSRSKRARFKTIASGNRFADGGSASRFLSSLRTQSMGQHGRGATTDAHKWDVKLHPENGGVIDYHAASECLLMARSCPLNPQLAVVNEGTGRNRSV